MEYQLTGYMGDTLLTWTLFEGDTTIGRSSAHPVFLPDRSVSRAHAVVHRHGDSLQIEDLGSRNGTAVNGERIRDRRALQPGDKLSFGNISLHVATSDSTMRFSDAAELNTLRFTWDDIQSLPPSDLDSTSSLFQVVMSLGKFLVQDHTEQEVYEACLNAVERLFPFHQACILVLDESRQPVLRASRPKDVTEKQQTALSRSMVEAVIRERTSLLVRDAQNSRSWEPSDSVILERISSALVVPLFDNTDVVGVLYLDSRDMSTAYTKKQLRRLALLANILAVKITNTKLLEERRRKTEEMQAAARIQRNFLCSAPPCPRGYELCVRLDSCTEVAGDLYDVLALPSGKYLFVLGDVVGHGVGAALLMANALAVIRSLVRHLERPRELVESIHDQLCQAVESRNFVTMVLGVLDPVQH
ncbi:MAG: FHA domain-containing protein, partial [Candidatus Krumholzibacteriia bacterium]